MSEERIRKNIKVLEALASYDKTMVSTDLFKDYTGWGGLREAIFTPAIYKELRKYLNDDEISSIKKTSGSAYYTPELLVKFIWTALQRIGFEKGDILEPAVGTGIFLDHVPLKIKQASSIDAIEIDRVTCNILVNKHPEIHLTCSGFETVYFGKKRYDLIISNPPYGREAINDIFDADLSQLIIHHWFVAKAARLLKDRGIIAMVVPQFFLDNVKGHARDIISNSGVNMLAAYRLPDNLFAVVPQFCCLN